MMTRTPPTTRPVRRLAKRLEDDFAVPEHTVVRATQLVSELSPAQVDELEFLIEDVAVAAARS